MTRFYLFQVVALISVFAFVVAQDDVDYNNDYGQYAEYNDFNNDYQEEDALYYDYSLREEQKNSPAAGGVGGAAKLAITGIASWILGGRFHSGRAVKDLKRKHKSEQKKTIQPILQRCVQTWRPEQFIAGTNRRAYGIGENYRG